MPFCTACGRPVADRGVICPACGGPHRPFAPAPRPRRSMARLLGLGCLVLGGFVGGLGVLGSLGFWYFSSRGVTKTPIGAVGVSAKAPATLGSLEQHGVRVELPAGAFASSGRVTLSKEEGDVSEGVDSERFALVGTPIDVSLDGRAFTRTDEPVTVSFRLPSGLREQLEDPDALRLAYRFAGEWHLQRMDHVDLEVGVASTRLRHFSEISPAAAKKKEIRSEVSQDIATGLWEQQHNKKAFTQAMHGPIEQLIVKMTGVRDPSVIKAIVDEAAGTTAVTSLLKSGAEAYLDGRNRTAAEAELATKLAEVSLNYLARKAGNVEADFGGEVGMAAALVQGGTAGGMGNYEMAAKELAKGVIGTTALGKLVLAATKVTEVSIAAWKRNGIEEMYQAYKEGANGLYGFDVTAGDFATVLEQSAAVERQVRLDAVAEYCRVHAVGESELSALQLESIKRRAIERLRASFEARRAEESQIAEMKRFYDRLLDEFEDVDLDATAMRRDSFSALTYEQRLHRYHQISKSILGLTGKRINFSGDSYGDFISDNDLTQAMRKWIGSKEEALEFLRSKGLMPEEIRVVPIQVTATGVHRYGPKPKQVLTISVRFTNTGSQQPGHGAVSGRAIDALDGEVIPISGSFSGGPNGSFTVTADGETIQAQLSAGRTITVPGYGTLTVQNPSAFDAWER